MRSELVRHEFDPALVERAKIDPKAQAELCERYKPLMLRIATLPRYRFLDREELLQEARIALLAAVAEYQGKGSFSQLLDWRIHDAAKAAAKAARRAARPITDSYTEQDIGYDEENETAPNVGRKLAALVHESHEREHGTWGGSTGQIDPHEIESFLEAAEGALPPDEYTLLAELHGIAGHEKRTQEEIAARLGVSQAAVSKKVKAIRRKAEQAYWDAEEAINKLPSRPLTPPPRDWSTEEEAKPEPEQVEGLTEEVLKRVAHGLGYIMTTSLRGIVPGFSPAPEQGARYWLADYRYCYGNGNHDHIEGGENGWKLEQVEQYLRHETLKQYRWRLFTARY